MARTTISFSLLAATLLAGALAQAHADVYRWVDRHGVVHYSDQWRAGATRIATATGSPNGAASTGGTPGVAAEDQEANQQIQQAADERAVQSAEAQLRAKRCEKAKADYQKLLAARRLFTEGKDGKRHYMSDAEADATRVKARQIMNQDCGSGSSS